MKSRLLDYDPVTRIKRMFHPSTDGDNFVESGRQDVTERLAINKALYGEERRWGDGLRAASIPITVWEGLMRDGTADDPKKLKAWLNDPDNRAFRTMSGRI